MKIAVFTLSDHYNQGNRLQNYALRHVLQQYGHEVSTYSAYPVKILAYVLPLALKLPNPPMFKRMRRFLAFTNQNLGGYTPIDFYSKKKLDSLKNQYDVFLAGSDQIWNPAYAQVPYAYFLQFADRDKTIAYAPSFGTDKINKHWEKIIENGVKHIKYLSVREEDGAKIITKSSKHIIPPPSVVLDPTLLLTKDEWMEFATEPIKKPKKKYILSYLIPNKNKNKKIARKIAKECGLELVEINNAKEKYYLSTPSEFISLISDAEFVCTSSFHGHALSVILEKPFVTIPNTQSPDSRIATLLNTIGISDRNYATLSREDYAALDYTEARERLRQKREQSLSFLTTSLEKIEKGSRA